jgi:RND family efflux transporter MFP subunit
MASAKVEAARSQVRMLEAKADSAKSQIDVITAKSTGAQAVVQETAIPLRDTALKSPLNGVVLEKSIEKGTLVSSGTKAFVVADTSTVKAVFAVADVALPEMKLGRVLSVESETMGGTEFRGQITAVFPAADKQNRSFDVEVTIPNADYRLRPNMIVSLHVNTREAASAQPVVPLNAVLKAKNGYAVFVVTDEGGRQVARLRDIKLGEAYGNTVAVTGGVKQGELVITTGSTMVLDGVQVKVIP